MPRTAGAWKQLQTWIPYPRGATLIVPGLIARAMGGPTRLITLVPRRGDDY